jgi:hypothetical protein
MRRWMWLTFPLAVYSAYIQSVDHILVVIVSCKYTIAVFVFLNLSAHDNSFVHVISDYFTTLASRENMYLRYIYPKANIQHAVLDHNYLEKSFAENWNDNALTVSFYSILFGAQIVIVTVSRLNPSGVISDYFTTLASRENMYCRLAVISTIR